MTQAARILLVVLFVGTVGCDHVTKHAASTHFRSEAVSVIPGVLEMTYTENRDTAFSLLRSLPVETRLNIVRGLGLLALVFVVVIWRRRRKEPLLEHVGYAIVVGGALGNLIDRFFRGYVVDFIHVPYWPVFNVADAAIVVGGALLVIAMWRSERDAPKEGVTPGAHAASG